MSISNVKLGYTVAVIGGGNTAIDSARTALRLGQRVIVLARRTIDAMPAYESEIHEAIVEGVEIVEFVSPVRFIKGKDGSVARIECIKMKLGNLIVQAEENGTHKWVQLYAGSGQCYSCCKPIPDLPLSKRRNRNYSWEHSSFRRIL